jgi:ATP-dependent protease ClpP protease subunit
MSLLSPQSAAKPKPIFAAAKKANVLELCVYNEIGQNWCCDDGVTPASVQQALKDAGKVDSITVRINSPGGASFVGVAIHNILRQQGVPVSVIVEGLAASAAFTVAMAGDTIQVCDGAMMMLHNAWSCAVGDANAMREMADLLDKVSGTMRDLYAKRSGLSAGEVSALMDDTTWLTPQEAVEKGFATALLKTTPEKANEAKALAAQFDLARFYGKIPERVKQAIAVPPGPPGTEDDAQVPPGPPGTEEAEYGMVDCACDCSSCKQGDCSHCSNEDCDDDNCVHEGETDAKARARAARIATATKKDTKRVDKKDLPKSCFAYRPDDKKENWKLPIESPDHDKEWEANHIRNAISRWGQTDMPDKAEKDKARDRIKAAAKAHDITVDEDSLKDSAAQPDIRARRLRLAELEAGPNISQSVQ